MKLAPIFQKAGSCTPISITDGDSEDDKPLKILSEEEKEMHRVRREFLFSGVPTTLKKQQVGQEVTVATEYAPWPSISHVQQISSPVHLHQYSKQDKTNKEKELEAKLDQITKSSSLCDKQEVIECNTQVDLNHSFRPATDESLAEAHGKNSEKSHPETSGLKAVTKTEITIRPWDLPAAVKLPVPYRQCGMPPDTGLDGLATTKETSPGSLTECQMRPVNHLHLVRFYTAILSMKQSPLDF